MVCVCVGGGDVTFTDKKPGAQGDEMTCTAALYVTKSRSEAPRQVQMPAFNYCISASQIFWP